MFGDRFAMNGLGSSGLRRRKPARSAGSRINRRRPLVVERLETRALPGFLAPLHFDAGRGPNSVAVGDFNGDGFPDLVTANLASGDVSVLLGNGDGTFQPPRNMAIGGNPAAVVVGEFDGDSIPDLAVATPGDNSVKVLLGNGDGSFRLAGSLGVGPGPQALAVARLRGEQSPLDLVVANTGGNTVSVLLGNGDGTFQPARDFVTGSRPVSQPGSIGVADFDGDGIPDLVVANFADFFGTGGVSVLLGNGDGTFQPAQNFFGDRTQAVAVGDFNGDGIPDFAVIEAQTSVAVFLGNGDGTFRGGGALFDTAGFARAIAVGDFNGDHIPDLVVAVSHTLNGQPDEASVYLGNGDGTFQAARNFVTGAGATSVAVGDFNGDGISDLAVAADNGVSVLLGQGGGAFPVTPNFPLSGRPDSAAVGDFNGDGIPDLVTANPQGPGVSLLLGNGDGTFQPPRTFSAGGEAEPVQVADFNGDHNLDLVVANRANRTVTVLLGNGDGTFQAPRTFAVGGQPTVLAVGDFNGDGIPDLAVTFQVGNTVDVLLGNGDGTFQAPRTFTVGGHAGAIAVRDLNGDGIPDLVVATDPSLATGTVSVLLGNGDGTFRAPRTVAAGGFPSSVAVGDFNGDGIPDLAVANINGTSSPETVSVLLGNGDGTFQAPLTVAAGRPPADVGSVPVFSTALIAVGDFNRDGVDDLAVVTDAGIRLVLGNRAGDFQTFPFVYNTGGGSHSVAVGDFNRDGFPDLAVANTSTLSAFILLNDTVWPSGPGPSGGGNGSRPVHAPTGRARAAATGPARPATQEGEHATPPGLASAAPPFQDSAPGNTPDPVAGEEISLALRQIPEMLPLFFNESKTSPASPAVARSGRARDLLFMVSGLDWPSLAIVGS
jgi:hypothetical protein